MAEDKDMLAEEQDGAEDNYITLTDDEGNDVSFELVGTVEHGERFFVVLIPFDDENGDEVVILEVVQTDDPDYDDYVGIDDPELLETIFGEFREKYKDRYDFQ